MAAARLLIAHGAPLTLRSAAALGDLDLLRSALGDDPAQLELYRDGDDGLLTLAVKFGQYAILQFLLEAGLDPDERQQLTNLDEETYSWGMPLWHAAAYSEYEMAELLISHGADVNASVYASGPPIERAYGVRDEKMKTLLRRRGAVTMVETIGLNRDTDAARNLLEKGAPAHTDRTETTPTEQLMWAAACGGDPEIVRMALPHIEGNRSDPWWSSILIQPMRIWGHGPTGRSGDVDRSTYPTCLELLLNHDVDPDVTDHHGYTALQHLAQAGVTWGVAVMTEEERVAFGHLLVDAGASLTVRDPLLQSTPLAWACRWGRGQLVELLLESGAPVVEPGAEPWATPLAWAQKMGHEALVELLRGRDAIV